MSVNRQSLDIFENELNTQFATNTFDPQTNLNKMLEFLKIPEFYEDPKLGDCLSLLSSKLDLSMQYTMAFTFLENYQPTQYQDNVQSAFFAFLAKFCGEESSKEFLEKFKEYFHDKECHLQFLALFLQKMYQNDLEELKLWINVLAENKKTPFSPFLSVYSVDTLLPFILNIDNQEYLDRTFQEAISPGISITLDFIQKDTGTVSNSPSHSKAKFINKDVADRVVTLLNTEYVQYKEKFIQAMTRNILRMPSMQVALCFKEILFLLYDFIEIV